MGVHYRTRSMDAPSTVATAAPTGHRTAAATAKNGENGDVQRRGTTWIHVTACLRAAVHTSHIRSVKGHCF